MATYTDRSIFHAYISGSLFMPIRSSFATCCRLSCIDKQESNNCILTQKCTCSIDCGGSEATLADWKETVTTCHYKECMSTAEKDSHGLLLLFIASMN